MDLEALLNGRKRPAAKRPAAAPNRPSKRPASDMKRPSVREPEPVQPEPIRRPDLVQVDSDSDTESFEILLERELYGPE